VDKTEVNDLLTIAGCVLVAGLVAYNEFAQRMASAGIRSPRIRCFLGLHSWKPRCKWKLKVYFYPELALPVYVRREWVTVSRRCRCCGKLSGRA
jgi:hypothetical protein